MTLFEHLRQRLESRAGIPLTPIRRLPSLEELKHTQWSTQFETYMRNRLLMGAFRYGILASPRKPSFNSIESIRKRLDLYAASGNTEHLVDIANLCMVEFVEGKHPRKHFTATDDGTHALAK